MLRHEVEAVIRRHRPGVQHLFADRWERWPVSPVADEISEALLKQAKIYQGLGLDGDAMVCSQAAEEIQARKQY